MAMLDKAKDWISRDIADRIHTAVQDLQSLSDFELHLSNKIQFLLDAVLGFINTEQNDIFKVLTIVSVVGIQAAQAAVATDAVEMMIILKDRR